MGNFGELPKIFAQDIFYLDCDRLEGGLWYCRTAAAVLGAQARRRLTAPG